MDILEEILNMSTHKNLKVKKNGIGYMRDTNRKWDKFHTKNWYWLYERYIFSCGGYNTMRYLAYLSVYAKLNIHLMDVVIIHWYKLINNYIPEGLKVMK